MEHLPPPSDGAQAHDQERVKDVVSRIVEEALRRSDLSPRRLGEQLAEWGWFGRGQEDPFTDSTVRSWSDRRHPPNSYVLIALALAYGISVDDFLYGSGLRGEVDRLKERTTSLERSLSLLVGEIGDRIPLEQTISELNRIFGRRDG